MNYNYNDFKIVSKYKVEKNPSKNMYYINSITLFIIFFILCLFMYIICYSKNN